MSEDLTQYARRKTVARGDHTLSYSIPAGVTDDAAAAEVAEMERAIARGYTMKGAPDRWGMRINVKWLVRQPPMIRWLALRLQRLSRTPRLLDRAYFWLKCRWLDVYWFVKDRAFAQAEVRPKQTHDGED